MTENDQPNRDDEQNAEVERLLTVSIVDDSGDQRLEKMARGQSTSIEIDSKKVHIDVEGCSYGN